MTPQAKQAHLRGMEAQVASLRSLAGRLDGAADRCRRGAAAHVSAQARVAAELSAVHAETSTLEARLDDVMHSLEAACEDLLRLAHDEPERWLLCVADMSEYEQQDEAARQLFDRHAAVTYTHPRAHETKANLVCRTLPEKKKYDIFCAKKQKHNNRS